MLETLEFPTRDAARQFARDLRRQGDSDRRVVEMFRARRARAPNTEPPMVVVLADREG